MIHSIEHWEGSDRLGTGRAGASPWCRLRGGQGPRALSATQLDPVRIRILSNHFVIYSRLPTCHDLCCNYTSPNVDSVRLFAQYASSRSRTCLPDVEVGPSNLLFTAVAGDLRLHLVDRRHGRSLSPPTSTGTHAPLRCARRNLGALQQSTECHVDIKTRDI